MFKRAFTLFIGLGILGLLPSSSDGESIGSVDLTRKSEIFRIISSSSQKISGGVKIDMSGPIVTTSVIRPTQTANVTPTSIQMKQEDMTTHTTFSPSITATRTGDGNGMAVFTGSTSVYSFLSQEGSYPVNGGIATASQNLEFRKTESYEIILQP